MSGRLRTLIALALAVTLVAGIYAGGHPQSLPGPIRDLLVDEEVARQAEALDAIEENYYRPVSGSRLQNSSINGMVQLLKHRYKDDFSHYFDPRTYERFKESTEGRFEGVGLAVNGTKRGLRVGKVFDGSPAEKAGIEEGDLIVAVNGDSIAGKDAEEATARIKGPAGTSVRLTVEGPTKKRRELKVKRAEIHPPAAEGKLKRAGGEKVAYVQYATFSSGSHGKLREEIDRQVERGARGIVLDLRGNGGGLLTEAILATSVFIERGVVTTTSGRKRPREILTVLGGALPRRPMVVLVNRDSASASEILTAALKEHHIATVVGTRTFGKGYVQELFELEDGGALDLTIGEYRTARGERVQGKGVTPDVKAVDKPRTKRDEALDRALEVLGRKLEQKR